jgi:hypothetical protein
VQLSAFADLESATWDVSVDGRWSGPGPGDHPVTRFPEVDPRAVDSARLVAVWLENGDVFTLSAQRPRGARGQDRDDVSVVLPASHAPMQVFDPRLSSEYAADGRPQRFGVELWLGEDPDGDQRPLRLAGEADGAGASDGPVSVVPMRAHSAGVPGRGIYILIRA